MSYIKRIQELLKEKNGLDLNVEQIKEIDNPTELLEFLENDIPIEFEWTFTFSTRIFDQSFEGAKNFIEVNLYLSDLDQDEIIWNPIWQPLF